MLLGLQHTNKFKWILDQQSQNDMFWINVFHLFANQDLFNCRYFVAKYLPILKQFHFLITRICLTGLVPYSLTFITYYYILKQIYWGKIFTGYLKIEHYFVRNPKFSNINNIWIIRSLLFNRHLRATKSD